MTGWILAFLIAILLNRMGNGFAMFGHEFKDPLFVWLSWLSAGVGCLLLFDWMLARTKHWVQEMGSARAYPLIAVANAIKHLPPQGYEFLEAKSMTMLELITGPGDEPTIVTLVCVNGKVPVGFIGDYLKASEHTWPFLLPIRDAKKLEELKDWSTFGSVEDLAHRLTYKLIDDGIADSFKGRYAAKIKDKYTPEYIRLKYHVED